MTALLCQQEFTDVKLISLKNMFSFVSCEYSCLEEFNRLGIFLRLGKLNFGVKTMFFQHCVSVSDGEVP